MALLQLLPYNIEPRTKVPGKRKLTSQLNQQTCPDKDDTYHDGCNKTYHDEHDEHDKEHLLPRFLFLFGLLFLFRSGLTFDNTLCSLGRLTGEDGFDEFLELRN